MFGQALFGQIVFGGLAQLVRDYLEANLSATAEVSAQLNAKQLLDSAFSGAGSVYSALIKTKELAGMLGGYATVTATLKPVHILAAQVIGIGELLGNLRAVSILASVMQGTGSVAATMERINDCLVEIISSAAMSGTLSRFTSMAATMFAVANIELILHKICFLDAPIAAKAELISKLFLYCNGGLKTEIESSVSSEHVIGFIAPASGPSITILAVTPTAGISISGGSTPGGTISINDSETSHLGEIVIQEGT